MPSCHKLFEELGKCLQASECMKSHGLKAQECMEKLMVYKTYERLQLNAGVKPINQDLLPVVDERAPKECALKHQAYVECKVQVMNPQKRMRPAYESRAPEVNADS